MPQGEGNYVEALATRIAKHCHIHHSPLRISGTPGLGQIGSPLRRLQIRLVMGGSSSQDYPRKDLWRFGAA